MKYVVFRNTRGEISCRFALAPVTHRELADEHAHLGKPISAGFLRVRPHGIVETYGYSETLQLGPATTDASTFTLLLRATEELGAAADQALVDQL